MLCGRYNRFSDSKLLNYIAENIGRRFERVDKYLGLAEIDNQHIHDCIRTDIDEIRFVVEHLMYQYHAQNGLGEFRFYSWK